MRLRKPRKLSFASVSAERYALSAYTSADVLAWFKSPSNFWLSCTLASVTSYWGADNPFVGTWNLNLAKSKFDPGPAVRSRTVTIEPAGDGVKWSIEQVDANGNRATEVEILKFDGKD